MKNYKLVVYVPITHADTIRTVLGNAGAGKIGGYSFCSFSTSGKGRFLPEVGTHPYIGESGVLEVVEEEKIEVTVREDLLKKVIIEMKKAHPYEEVAYDLYLLETF